MSAIPHPIRVPLSEYLATSYRPDCDYVDGEILERNFGEKEHAILLRALILLFGNNSRDWKIEVFPELRVQINPPAFACRT